MHYKINTKKKVQKLQKKKKNFLIHINSFIKYNFCTTLFFSVDIKLLKNLVESSASSVSGFRFVTAINSRIRLKSVSNEYVNT